MHSVHCQICKGYSNSFFFQFTFYVLCLQNVFTFNTNYEMTK